MFDGISMNVVRTTYEISTTQGTAKLIHTSYGCAGPPVLFVHGFGSRTKIWFKYPESMGNILASEGIDVWALVIQRRTGDTEHFFLEFLEGIVQLLFRIVDRLGFLFTVSNQDDQCYN